MVERLADGDSRLADPTLSQSQQRKPWLRVGQPSTGRQEAAFRVAEPPAQPVQLTQPVVRLACGGVTAEQGARVVGLLDSIGPLAAELHQVGPVHQADAPVRNQSRLGVAPPVQRRRPLASPAQIEDRLALGNDRAVHDAAGSRRHLPRGDREHGFVEPEHRLADPARRRQHLALAQSADRDEVRLVESSTELGDLGSGGKGNLELTGVQLHQEGRDQQEAPFGIRAFVDAGESIAAAREPGGGLHFLSTQEQADAEPRGPPRRPPRLSLSDPGAETASRVLVCVGITAHISADEVGSVRQQVEVRSIQGRDSVGFGQASERLRPHPPVEGGASLFAQLLGADRRLSHLPLTVPRPTGGWLDLAHGQNYPLFLNGTSSRRRRDSSASSVVPPAKEEA